MGNRKSPLPLFQRRRKSAGGPAQSKTWRLCFCFLFSALCFTAHAQYSIDWHTIDGGGGPSTGGPMSGVNYSVSGTTGQPDAGAPMTNGQYAVRGGFWALPAAVQVAGAPILTIVPATPGNATISWTPMTPGFVLQETLSLSPTNWMNSVSGANNPIVVPATLPSKLYRLFKPLSGPPMNARAAIGFAKSAAKRGWSARSPEACENSNSDSRGLDQRSFGIR